MIWHRKLSGSARYAASAPLRKDDRRERKWQGHPVKQQMTTKRDLTVIARPRYHDGPAVHCRGRMHAGKSSLCASLANPLGAHQELEMASGSLSPPGVLQHRRRPSFRGCESVHAGVLPSRQKKSTKCAECTSGAGGRDVLISCLPGLPGYRLHMPFKAGYRRQTFERLQ